MKFFNLSAESSEVIKLYRRHLRIDIKHYLKRKFGKHLHLIPNEAFECVRVVPDNDDEHYETALYTTKIFYLYQPFYIRKNIRTVLIKDDTLIKK